MAYFTQEQCRYLESMGFERMRCGSYWLKFDDCYGRIIIEALVNGFGVLIETTFGIRACSNADDLKEAVQSAMRRYKDKTEDIKKMVGHIDEIYKKTEGIPK